jgi:hypothetical protein
MPVLTILIVLVIVLLLPKPEDEILELIATIFYGFVALVVVSILTFQFGWDKP